MKVIEEWLPFVFELRRNKHHFFTHLILVWLCLDKRYVIHKLHMINVWIASDRQMGNEDIYYGSEISYWFCCVLSRKDYHWLLFSITNSCTISARFRQCCSKITSVTCFIVFVENNCPFVAHQGFLLNVWTFFCPVWIFL